MVCVQFTDKYEMKNQQMSLFQFYSYIDGSLHVSGLQAHLQESSQLFTQPLVQYLYCSGQVLRVLWPVLVTVLYQDRPQHTEHAT